MSSYEIQGRRREKPDVRSPVLRDDVRLAATQDRHEALKTAAAMAADGFTVWVFEIEQRAGRKTYSLVDFAGSRSAASLARPGTDR